MRIEWDGWVCWRTWETYKYSVMDMEIRVVCLGPVMITWVVKE